MIDQFLIGKMRNFVYLITSEGLSFVVDPTYDIQPWMNALNKLGSSLSGILLTHSHHDHVGGLAEIFESCSPPIYIHETDYDRISGKFSRDQFVFLKDGDTLNLGSLQISCIHTPGHSAGEMSYFIEKSDASLLNRKGEKIAHLGPWLFSGDTIFVGDVGRTDFTDGSNDEMFSTIQRIKTLPSQTMILSGHDYGRDVCATIAEEMIHSAAFRCKTVEELASLP